jgi:hypothetical protein
MLEVNCGDIHNSHFAGDKSLSKDFLQKHTIMCRNGTKIPLTAIPDDNCALTVVTGGEVSCLL